MRPPFRAVEMESEGEREQRRVALRLDSGDALILGPDHPLHLVADEHGPSPASSSATGLRPSLPGRSITSLPRSPLPKATSRRASGATGPSSRSSSRDRDPRDRLRAALERAAVEPLLAGDDSEPGDVATPAAVLIAITDRPEPGIILTVRHADLRTHAGQVAFPGGRIDAGEDAAAAALREAWEELGLDPSVVEPVASLDPYRTVTGYA